MKRGIMTVALLGTLSLVAAACGSSGPSSSSGSSGSPSPTSSGGQSTAPPSTGKKLTIGYVVAGDEHDGGFYQGQVQAVQQIDQQLGYKTIVVDNVNPGASQEIFRNLAAQGPDVIIAGGAELAPGFVPVSKLPQFSKTLFILITAAPPSTKTYATAGGDERQAHYLGGVAAALLLKRLNGNTACDVAGPELDFVKSAANEMLAGMHYVNPQDKLLVTYTGDFENAALATEAANALIHQGCKVIYPYLGGALSAADMAGTQAGIDVVATSYDRCNDTTPKFAMSILYNPQIYLEKVIKAIAAGGVTEGKQFALYGVKDGIGAVICNATPQEQQVLDTVKQKIASGQIDVSKVKGANG